MRTLLYLLFWLLWATPLTGQCIGFGSFAATGNLPNNLLPLGTLHEVSGLEASRSNPGVLWAHDDSGHGPELVALTTKGQLVQQYRLAKVPNGDWEDIALGPGPQPGRDYLYLGEIGNNNGSFTLFALLRIPEPRTPKSPGATRLLQNVEVFIFRYPSASHDAETLLIDPIDRRPYILTKETGAGAFAYLYGYPMPLDGSKIKTLNLELKFTHPAPSFSGGDVADDGSWIHVRNQSRIYSYPRMAGARFATAFQAKPCELIATGQGNAEALTISADGLSLFATSEGVGAPLYQSKGTVPTGSVAYPAWWSYGSGLGSAGLGVPGLGLDRVPRLGAKPGLHLWAARPASQAALAFSLTALPDGQKAFAGGWAHVLPDLVLMFRTSALGTASLPLGTVPNKQSLLGAKLHTQAVVEDQAATKGLGLSRGLTLQVGR